MRLLTCGHCGRPFYDNEKACPYCGHAFTPSTEATDEVLKPQNEELEQEQKQEQEPMQEQECIIDAPAETPLPTTNTTYNSRSESIAAITAANSHIAADNSNSECDPNQIETSYPPRHRRIWVWIVIILLLVALTAAAYIYRDHLQHFVGSILK